MDSIGSGELLVIAVVALLALDPRTAGRWWARARRLQAKLLAARDDLEREIRAQVEPEEPRRESAQVRLRRWARERVEALGQSERDQAPARLLERLEALPGFAEATEIAAFLPLPDELPLEPVLRHLLAQGKTVWLPWLGDAPGAMGFAPVTELDTDLVAGRWNLREPRGTLRGRVPPRGLPALVPGQVFDLHGSRIGRGGGYYDRWLADRPDVVAIGIAWDAQVHPGRLPVAPHDRPMRHLVTEQRLVTFPAGPVAAPEESGVFGTAEAALTASSDRDPAPTTEHLEGGSNA